MVRGCHEQFAGDGRQDAVAVFSVNDRVHEQRLVNRPHCAGAHVA
jgi:hypothetical protein